MVHSLRVGTLRQRAELVSRLQIWHRSAQSWLACLGEVPRVGTQLAFDAAGGIKT